MRLRCATFNVLADAYTGYADYSYVEPDLLEKGARIPKILQVVSDLKADVVCMQEAELPLLTALDETSRWQTYWSQKGLNKPDGCLTLVKQGIDVADFETHYYDDQSGHVMQSVRIGQTLFVNTHIKWAPEDASEHAGVIQTKELLEEIGSEQPAIIFADCNSRPDGLVRRLVEDAGFTNVSGDTPTAFVDQEPVALDLLAVRGVTADHVNLGYSPLNVPNMKCPSDHIPLIASIEIA